MPRQRRRDDDSDEFEPIRTPRKKNTGLWVALVVVGFLVLACGGVVGVMAIGWVAAGGPRDAGNKPRNVKLLQEKKTYSRDEFKMLVEGKTEAQVLDLLGRPDKTEDDRFGTWKFWYYLDRVVDAEGSGKVDHVAAIYFSPITGWKCQVDGFREAMTRPAWTYR